MTTTILEMREELEKRLARGWKEDETTGCHVWQKGPRSHPYGRMKHKGVSHYTHRVAWTLAYGPIPPGMVVQHSCDNPACVNPHHLRVGTQHDNVHDSMSKGRKPPIERKLSWYDAVAIREAWERGRGKIKQVDMAQMWGISEQHVNNIIHYRKWAA